MQNIINVLIGLAIIAFLAAVITVITQGNFFWGFYAESFSRASANLSLIAIALSVCCPKKKSAE